MKMRLFALCFAVSCGLAFAQEEADRHAGAITSRMLQVEESASRAVHDAKLVEKYRQIRQAMQ